MIIWSLNLIFFRKVSGQVMQPSDARIKTVLREVDPKEQLRNVNKIKIVQYKYKPEYLNQLPEENRNREYKPPITENVDGATVKNLPRNAFDFESLHSRKIYQ